MNLFSVLPERGAVLHGDMSNFFADVSVEDGPQRLLELARYYYYGDALTWFVWGTNGILKGKYSPKLQQLVDNYNQMNPKREWDISGYFALMYTSRSWIAYYTPWDPEGDTESIDVDISEEEALALATEFVNIGFIDLNNHLNRVFNFTLFLYNSEKGQ